MGKMRSNRIAEEIKRELAQIIRTELKDPRIKGLISITSVEVTGDLRYAEVFISHYGNKEEQVEVINALKKAAGFMRSELGKRIRLRFTPELLFKFDESMEHGAKISAILSQINTKQEDSNGRHSKD
ncbi:MAG: ribosome-binding factor [Clostridia bacterium]|jgi:ribosome-binding factor A|nr:ribosome-binding factor [Clostridia bacterium]MDN5323255.1 ribosome-binding factor [Clostridia bacterium]